MRVYSAVQNQVIFVKHNISISQFPPGGDAAVEDQQL